MSIPTKESIKEVTKKNQMAYVWSYNAVLNRKNGDSDFIYGGELRIFAEKEPYINALKENWDISNAKQLKQTVKKQIQGQTHNVQFFKDFDFLLKMGEGEYRNYQESTGNYLVTKTIWKNKKSLQKNGIIALELTEASAVLGFGYMAGYISEDEAYKYCLEIGRKMQSHFSSYKEMSDNYLLGYFYLVMSSGPYKVEKINVDSILQDPKSSWNAFPFNYSMEDKSK